MNHLQALIYLFLLASCAHHPDVRPMASGTHIVKIRSVEPAEASQEALSQAASYCKSVNKQLMVKNEESKYIGTVDEKMYKAGKALGRVAGIVTAGIMDKESVVNKTLGQGYETTLTFHCQ